MAVAGLHNVPDFAPSFFGESQKRDSGRWDDDHHRRSTRASALLQMWREIEGEHVLSPSYRSRQQRNGSDSECRSTFTSVGDGSENGDAFSQVSDESENQGISGSETEHEDNNSVISEQSSDLGEIERERVRQIFQEWMDSCRTGHQSYGFNLKDRSGHCLGDVESERVKILRERAQTTAQPRSDSAASRGGAAEVGSEIMHGRDGSVINHPARRPLRRLCGRQTLLDLLLKAQNERKRELLSLSEQRPVSDFSHRNRIQALLRGRFLRTGGVAVEERPSSRAASELGVLRQRHTVSDLREGFLSKLDSFGSASVNINESDPSSIDGNKGESQYTCTEGGDTINHIAADLEDTSADGNMNIEELEVHIDVLERPVMVNEGDQENMELSADIASSVMKSALATEARQHGVSVDIHRSGSSEVQNQDKESISGASSVHDVGDHTTYLEGNTNDIFDSHDASVQVEESQELVTENEESVGQNVNIVALTEWTDGRQDTDRCWQERASSQSSSLPSGSNDEEQDQMQESHDYPRHDLQEAIIDSWLDIPSSEAGESVRDVDTVYFPPYDDDNVNSVELRELFSRRRVSSLLHSGFRERLDHVLQSHAERLGHASVDWELESASFPPLIEQDQEHLNGDQSLAPSESAERNPFTQSLNNFEASQQLWNEDFQDAGWPHHYSNQLETEWDVISELRIDMARLQQRMNSMQGMLEACMDMQIELQRSLHQEVSAALSRSISSGGVAKDNGVHDESRWDHVKNGICCLCQQNKIDALLYRCGHMCTCTNCAENLVKSNGKCPMCCAPAVEAVRAYFVQ